MSFKLSVLAGVFYGVFSCSGVSAQDVIVTIQNDSISCLITETADMFIYYRTSSTKRGATDIISRKQVKEVIRGIHPPDPEISKKDSPLFEERFRFGFKGGYSQLVATADLDDGEFDDYYTERNGGFWYAADAVYMFEENFGAGVTICFSRYSNSVMIRDLNSGLTGRLADDMTVRYFGINFVTDLTSNRSRSGVMLSGGLGVTHFTNDFELFYPFKIRGFDFGMHLNCAYRLSVSPGVYIPIEVGLRGFSVNNVTYSTPSTTPPEMEESIGRFIRENLPAEVFRIETGIGLLITF